MNQQVQSAASNPNASPVSGGRELAGRALTEWFGYAWHGLYDRRITDRGFKPWTFNGLGNKEFQGGKLDVLDMVDKIVALASATSPGAILTQPASYEVSEILERADRYLSAVPNRSDTGPHHLVSDLAVALRSILAAPQEATDVPSNRAVSVSPSDDLLRLADMIDLAREEYLKKFGTANEPLASLLWGDKGTFAPALRLAATAAGVRGEAHTAMTHSDPDEAVHTEAYRRYPQENGTHRKAFLEGAVWSRARLPIPDRDLLVQAIALAMARDDIEPSSEATLAQYRDDAKFIAAGLVHGAFALQLASRRWRHLNRGSSYAEVGRATAQSAIPIVEGETVVVYVADVDGSMHVRKDTEFEDGRFVEISRHPPAETTK
jgi:hypothetical protein